MGSYRHRLSLTAYHDSADLSAVPAALGLKAKRLAMVGDPRIATDGRLTGSKYRFSVCSFDFDPEGNESLPENLAAVVAKLKPHKAFMNERTASGVRFEFFVGWFSEFSSRDVFSWQLLGDLAELKIALDLDFYGPDENEAKETA